MKQFIQTSIRERLLLQKLAKISKLKIDKFSPVDGYDKWDAIALFKNTKYLIESKIRFFDINSFDGWIIEKSKYDFLIAEAKENNMIPLYINFCNDGVMVWNLHKIEEPQWQLNELPQNSQDKDEKIIGKMVGYLPSKNSHHIFMSINRIKLSKLVQEIYKNEYDA